MFSVVWLSAATLLSVKDNNSACAPVHTSHWLPQQWAAAGRAGEPAPELGACPSADASRGKLWGTYAPAC